MLTKTPCLTSTQYPNLLWSAEYQSKFSCPAIPYRPTPSIGSQHPKGKSATKSQKHYQPQPSSKG